MIVVDTNVIAYLVAGNDADSVQAQAVFRRDPEWAAPLLWRSELRNVLFLKLRHGDTDLAGAISAVEIAAGVITGREFGVDSARVLELAALSGCTAYDCEFVGIAETLSVPLVTADKKILAAFPDAAISMHEFVG